MSKYKLDIEDLNYCVLHEAKNDRFTINGYSDSYFVLLKNIGKIILKSFYGFIIFIIGKNKTLKEVDYLFYHLTSNNERALAPIQANISNSSLLGINDMSLQASWRFAILFAPLILKKGLEAKGYYRKVYFSEFVELCTTYSYYKNAITKLNESKPKYLILSNDHVPLSRCYLRAAQKLGIKTVYIQHASVASTFPPLSFDYSFLDGLESYEKYLDAGPCLSQVYLSGGSRFDVINTIIEKRSITENIRLGVAINPLDSWDSVNDFIILLKKECPKLEIQIRPHPRMDVEKLKTFFKKENISISNPQFDSPFVFINDNDFFVSGESSIHLDISLSNKISLYCNLTKLETLDSYGYIKKGLILDISKDPIGPILKIINSNSNNLSSNTEIKRYYVANFDTRYWGKSSELIAKTLVGLINNTKLENWGKQDGVFIL